MVPSATPSDVRRCRLDSETGWNVAPNVGSCEAWVQLCLVVGLGEASLRCESGGKTAALDISRGWRRSGHGLRVVVDGL